MSSSLPVIAETPNDATVNSAGAVVEGLFWMIAVWFALIVATTIALLSPGALGAAHQVSFSRAVFTSFNAATSTGFSQQFADVENFAPFIRVMLNAEMIAGLWLSLIGGGLVLGKLLGEPVRLRTLFLITLLLTVAAAAAGLVTSQGDPVAAMLRGIAALAGAGPAQASHGWEGWRTPFVQIPLAFVGSIGVLAWVAIRSARPSLRRHIWNVLLLSACVYVGGLVLLGISFSGNPLDQLYLLLHGSRAEIDFWSHANAQVFASGGFGTPVDFASGWARDVVWTVMALSLIGIGTIGSVPSLGLGWFATLPRRFWQTILVLLGVQALIALLSFRILLVTEPQLSSERILMLVVSAVAKTGLSHEAVSITGPGLILLGGLMGISKLLPFGLLAGLICCRTPYLDPPQQ